MKIVKQRLHLLFATTIIALKSKIFNSPNIKHKATEISLKVFYRSIHGFLPHQLYHPSIAQHLDSYMKKYDTSKSNEQYMLKVIVTVIVKPLLKQI